MGGLAHLVHLSTNLYARELKFIYNEVLQKVYYLSKLISLTSFFLRAYAWNGAEFFIGVCQMKNLRSCNEKDMKKVQSRNVVGSTYREVIK